MPAEARALVVRPAVFLALAALLAGCGSTSSSSGTSTGSLHRAPTRHARRSHRRHHAHRHRRRHGAVKHTAAAIFEGETTSVCPPAAQALAGVYHPERLSVLDSCRTATGRVETVRHEDDGDVHFDVALDPAYRGLLRSGNTDEQHGWLVVEFMPRDGGHLPEPSVGDSIRLIGAWVDDAQHSWNEFHPVWAASIGGAAWHSSGPQYGGDAARYRSYNAAAGCRTAAGNSCTGYGYISPPGPASSTAPPSSSGGGDFCVTHRCISSFDEGKGSIVQCRDGMWSHSGGRPGSCSSHGGERR